MVNDQVFKLQLVSQLVDRIEHVISFPIKVFLAVVEEVLCLVVFTPKLLESRGLVLKLFLDIIELVCSNFQFFFLSP